MTMFTYGKSRTEELRESSRRRADRAAQEREDALEKKRELKARQRQLRLAKDELEKASNG